MIPILFDKTETTFTSNGKGRLVDCISCTVTEERNGVYELELEYPITGALFNDMQSGGIIGVIHDDNHDIQPFDIYSSSAAINGVMTFYAHHLSYRLNNIILKAFTATSAPDAISKIPTNSVNTNPFTFYTDKTTEANFKLKNPDSVRAILYGQEGSLLDTFGTADFEFDKWQVKMLQHRGSDTGVTVRYGKNLTGIEWEVDESETFNAIAPYWTDGQTVVTVTNTIVQPTTAITPVKPVAMDFSSDFENKPTQEQLTNKARKYLDDNRPWLPSDNMKVNFVAMWQTEEYKDVAEIQRIKLCDTVSIYWPEMGIIAEKAKIVRVVYNVLAERYDEIEIGTPTSEHVAIVGGAGAEKETPDLADISSKITTGANVDSDAFVRLEAWKAGRVCTVTAVITVKAVASSHIFTIDESIAPTRWIDFVGYHSNGKAVPMAISNSNRHCFIQVTGYTAAAGNVRFEVSWTI